MEQGYSERGEGSSIHHTRLKEEIEERVVSVCI